MMRYAEGVGDRAVAIAEYFGEIAANALPNADQMS